MYARRMEDVVLELAHHFEQGADWSRAIDYLRQAAEIAGRRHAHRQADTMLARALELVNHLPEAERLHAEPQPGALVARAADYGLIDVQVRDLRVPTSVCEWTGNGDHALELRGVDHHDWIDVSG
jgi:hypothetical protein